MEVPEVFEPHHPIFEMGSQHLADSTQLYTKKRLLWIYIYKIHLHTHAEAFRLHKINILISTKANKIFVVHRIQHLY